MTHSFNEFWEKAAEKGSAAEAGKEIPDDVMRAAYEVFETFKNFGTFGIIARAILAERARIVSRLFEEADLTPCSEDAMVTRSNARLIEADFSYEDAERLAEKEEA